MLLEEFKQCLPERMVLYLNEQKVTALSQAAVLADEFVLTCIFHIPSAKNSGLSRSLLNVQLPKQNIEKSREMRECFYCHKKGHVIVNSLPLFIY